MLLPLKHVLRRNTNRKAYTYEQFKNVVFLYCILFSPFDSESLLKSKIICMIELLLYKDVECE